MNTVTALSSPVLNHTHVTTFHGVLFTWTLLQARNESVGKFGLCALSGTLGDFGLPQSDEEKEKIPGSGTYSWLPLRPPNRRKFLS